MEIYISINNNEEVLQLPVLPDKFEVTYPYSNTTRSSITQGDMRLIGLKGLKTLSFSSFFPSKKYSFLREYNEDEYTKLTNEKSFYGWQYVKTIEKWMERRVPIRVIITDTPINLPMTIDSFQYGIDDGTGDIKYTISLTEFKFIELNEKKV